MSIFPSDAAYEKVYAEEAAMIDASELLADALEQSGLSRADLAKVLKVSRSEVTARLGGERNITVRKLAATLSALGRRLELRSVSVQSEPVRDVVELAFARRNSKKGAEKAHASRSGHSHIGSRHGVGARADDYLKVLAK